MSTLYASGLGLLAGIALVAALMTLWRHRVRTIVAMLRLQGVAVAGVAGVMAFHERDVILGLSAVLVLVIKAGVVPGLLDRIVRRDPTSREVAPIVNIPASLIFAALLVAVAYGASGHIINDSSSVSVRVFPIGIATVLVGYFVLVTRRRATPQIVGLLLVDNGIALVTFLLTAGMPLIVELGSTLDVLLVVVVLRVLVLSMGEHHGIFEPAEMRELRDE